MPKQEQRTAKKKNDAGLLFRIIVALGFSLSFSVAARELTQELNEIECRLLVAAPYLGSHGPYPWRVGQVTDLDIFYATVLGVGLWSSVQHRVVAAGPETVTVRVNFAFTHDSAEQNVEAVLRRGDSSVMEMRSNGQKIEPRLLGSHWERESVSPLEVPAGRYEALSQFRLYPDFSVRVWNAVKAPGSGPLLRMDIFGKDEKRRRQLLLVRSYNVSDLALPRGPMGPPLTAEPIQPLPRSLALDPEKTRLGKLLFEDKRLSRGNIASCLACHDPHSGGSDRIERAFAGQFRARGPLNTPTIFNAAFLKPLFWDGRAKSLQDQIDGPLQNPHELATNWPEVVEKLSAVPLYRDLFASLYAQQGIREATIKDALVAYESSLITPDAPFDRFLRGETQAIDAQQKRGYELFKSIGCIDCHSGQLIGGRGFARFSLAEKYFADRGEVVDEDYGRYNVTRRERDRFRFRIPSLRNIERTWPYLHDGSARTLADAIRVHERYHFGCAFSDSEVQDLVAFLNSLTGRFEGEPVR